MIPAFTNSGVLPPYIGAAPQQRANMTPYGATMSEFCSHFATSPERKAILQGLLSYRAAMLAAGFTDGFQWFDGSFVEEIENSKRARPPADIDIVTFAPRPVGVSGQLAWAQFFQQHPNLFKPQTSKQHYHCDAYFVDTSRPQLYVAQLATYWCGMFSHQRDSTLWKGMISVPLVSDDNVAAATI